MIRRLHWWEVPDEIPYIPGVQNWGGVASMSTTPTSPADNFGSRADGVDCTYVRMETESAGLISQPTSCQRSVYGVPWQTMV